MKLFTTVKIKLIHEYMRIFDFPKIYKIGKQFKVTSVEDTIRSLINSNKSLSRFGDGELGWLCGKNILPKGISFERTSNKLRRKLIHVIQSNNPKLEIGLSPLSEAKDYHYKFSCRRSLKFSMCELGVNWMKYLDKNKRYYNTNITRAYSAYKHYSYSTYIFNLLKKIWSNKKILIIEGRGTRLGVNNDLFNNVISIHRIECPSMNAFESYSKILKIAREYLTNHSVDLTLIALGPTATILACYLCNKGFRSIDVGHIDIEYEWFLRHKICNIPYKCVNEVKNGQAFVPIQNNKYYKEIVCNID